MLNEVLEYLPDKIRQSIKKYVDSNEDKKNKIEEIRLRINQLLTLKIGQDLEQINVKISREDINEAFENICEKSVYSYIKQIINGFITIKGGNRVGIVGMCVMEKDKVINVNYISSLNFRIARQIEGVSIPIYKYVIDIKNNSIFNTLIVSPPGSGKTTILRDLIKNLSNGIPEINFKSKTCGIVDERGEIAAVYKGIPQNDVGKMTDVITDVPKEIGINILIRSMAPEIIACDEIGTDGDIYAIRKAFLSGIKGIFTAHGETVEEIKKNKNLKALIEEKIIARIIVLDSQTKGQIKECFSIGTVSF